MEKHNKTLGQIGRPALYFDMQQFQCGQFQLVAWVKQQNKESNSTLEGFWIGMTDIEKEGNFKWRSNRTLSSDVDLYWGWSEPNNDAEGEPENCVVVHGLGPYINDVDCSTKRASVCQKRMSYTNENEDLSWWVVIGVLGGVVLILIGSLLSYCGYRISNKKKIMVRKKENIA